MFTQIKVRHVSEEVFDQIKSAIERKAETRREASRGKGVDGQLGVSRVPIREALKLLANMGLIETRQGGGSYVRPLLSDRLRDPLGHYQGQCREGLRAAGGAKGNRNLVGLLCRKGGNPRGRDDPRAHGRRNEDASLETGNIPLAWT